MHDEQPSESECFYLETYVQTFVVFFGSLSLVENLTMFWEALIIKNKKNAPLSSNSHFS